MPKMFIHGTILLLTMIMVTGCQATKDVTVRSYIQEKERVDQEVQGAVGNWENAPQAVNTNTKDTRKVYVLEFTKETDNEDIDLDIADSSAQISSELFDESLRTTKRQPPASTPPQYNLPNFDDGTTQSTTEEIQVQIKYVEYTVEKDDTLQKIAKKFYDSYSKWPMIYEANKSVIKDPNRIKPGITIRIPLVKQ